MGELKTLSAVAALGGKTSEAGGHPAPSAYAWSAANLWCLTSTRRCRPVAGTKVNHTSYLRRWVEYVKEQQRADPSFTAIVHPVSKVARFLRHLLATRFTDGKDPAGGAVDNIRKKCDERSAGC